jgi:very-short-patch-repair endonuclease
VAALADRQYGVVARRQLLALGLSSKAVTVGLRSRRLVRLHRGVYAVGHRRLSRDGFWMAATLAVATDGVLSHRDAAALHGLRRPHDGRIDVTTTSDARGTRAIRVHQTTVLTALDATIVDGIPVTTVARTLLDLAEALPRHQLAAALSEAERQNVLDVPAIEAAMRRTWGRRGRGHAALAKVLRRHAEHGATLTRSELERAFLAFLDRAGLPRPRMNAQVEGAEVDAYWRRARLIVELDGWAFHKTRAAFERDRGKRTALRAKGYEVTELTHHQLTRQPRWAAHQLRLLLAADAT